MIARSAVLYEYRPHTKPSVNRKEDYPVIPRAHTTRFTAKLLAFGLIAFSLGGLLGPLSTPVRLESAYLLKQTQQKIEFAINAPPPLPPSTPVFYDPLVTPEGSSIDPVNKEFSVIIPKIGVNAAVLPAVNPADPGEYLSALKKGIAHASTSFFPDEAGTVYLFSHSTNYDWFVGDLNAVFYLLKNLETDDSIILYYKDKQYIYKLTEKRIVNPDEVAYLVPQPGKRSLILQTCWPPGSTTERLLLFAEFVEIRGESI